MKPVVTRFAPSPTGFLHIGGARTALFNWLYAKRHNGKFLLRIEDTDRERSTEAAIDAILDGMKWLGLESDGEAIFQFARMERHAEVANELLAKGRAYHCYTTPEELTAFREANPHAKFRSPWRESSATPPAGAKPVIRLKAPQEGETVVEDKVKGRVAVANAELDDMVLLRSDGTPTYMLAVVVDDHDMGVTHVIRGDDHFTNTFRQLQIYDAMGWTAPTFAHVPLIHGADGAKLSKRHGALGVDAYRDMGLLPEAVCNYLLRLGWSHGDDEIIPTGKAIEWFDLEHISASPARFDMEKLNSINAHYMRAMDEDALLSSLRGFLPEAIQSGSLRSARDDGLKKLLPLLKDRAQTLVELAAAAQFVFARPALDEKAAKALDDAGKAHITAILPKFEALAEWNAPALEAVIKTYVTESGAKFPAVGMPLRAALTGAAQGLSVHDVMAALGKEESLKRLIQSAD